MDIVTRVNELLAASRPFCLATVVSSSDKEITLGTKTIVFSDGSFEGGTGKKEWDALLCEHAVRATTEKKRQMIEISPGVHVFFDIITESTKLVICGAGHIARPLAQFARKVGFSVTVIDDRADFANPAYFEGCEVIADDFVAALRKVALDRSTFVVIITRGHEHDVDCLIEILPKKAAYVGLIGSRRRVRFVLEWLENKGFSRQRLNEVFTPIGIPIGAESPDEIALSIVAELVCVRRKGAVQARALRSAVDIER